MVICPSSVSYTLFHLFISKQLPHHIQHIGEHFLIFEWNFQISFSCFFVFFGYGAYQFGRFFGRNPVFWIIRQKRIIPAPAVASSGTACVGVSTSPGSSVTTSSSSKKFSVVSNGSSSSVILSVSGFNSTTSFLFVRGNCVNRSCFRKVRSSRVPSA